MLFIQAVSLTWDKSSRGRQFAEARQKFPQAFPIETAASGEIVLQRLHFYQQGLKFLDDFTENRQSLEKFLPRLDISPERIQREIQERERFIRKHRVQVFSSTDALNLTNLSLQPCGNGCQVSFFYDEHRSGAPYRRGRNQDYGNPQSPFYCKDCLNEPAFELSPGQYGRILWNERRTGCDTGRWYYLLHIYHFYCVSGQVPEDLLTANEPDFVYQQLAELY